jgi:2'-5' RNA ligase
MKPRYFVAVPISSETEINLRDFYQESFLTKLPVKNLHLTLLAPFFLKENRSEKELIEKIKEIKFTQFTAEFTGLDFFEQKGRKILYAKIGPENKFLELAEKVKKTLENLVEMDAGPYTSGLVPSFKAHVTLDYNFTKNIPDNFPKLNFEVGKMSVFKEENKGWKRL